MGLGQSPNLGANEVNDLIINEALEGEVKDAQGSANKLLFIGGISQTLGVEPKGNQLVVVVVSVGVAAILLLVACFIFRRRIKSKLPMLSKSPSKETEKSKPKELKHEWKVANLRTFTWCHQCNKFLWGFANQGYECGHCHKIVCKICAFREGPGSQQCTARAESNVA